MFLISSLTCCDLIWYSNCHFWYFPWHPFRCICTHIVFTFGLINCNLIWYYYSHSFTNFKISIFNNICVSVCVHISISICPPIQTCNQFAAFTNVCLETIPSSDISLSPNSHYLSGYFWSTVVIGLEYPAIYIFLVKNVKLTKLKNAF